MTKAELVAQLQALNPFDVPALIDAKAEALGYDVPATPVDPPAEEPATPPADDDDSDAGDDDSDSV